MQRIFLNLLLFLFACSTGKGPHSQEEKALPFHEKRLITLFPETALTHEGALSRFKQIQKVNYNLWFHLDSENQMFQGKAVILFDLKPHAKDFGNQVVIDFEGGSLSSIQVNGTSFTQINSPERFDQHHLYFKLSELNSSSNRIEISYTHPYSTDGYGLHRFKDPIDQEVYVYSNFEPYSAHRLFPCFDQPDLKATYELTVEAPDHWKVISTQRETKISNLPGK